MVESLGSGAKLPAWNPSSAAYLPCDQGQVNYVPEFFCLCFCFNL